MYWEGKEPLRTFTCWSCQHMKDSKDARPRGFRVTKPCKSLCGITKRWGSLKRGQNCEKFEYKQWHNATAKDGTPIRNRQPEDYRTQKQWEEVGRKIKPNAIGMKMYANRINMKTKYTYYLVEQTEEI